MLKPALVKKSISVGSTKAPVNLKSKMMVPIGHKSWLDSMRKTAKQNSGTIYSTLTIVYFSRGRYVLHDFFFRVSYDGGEVVIFEAYELRV